MSIWLSTATEQLWSVASTKDISANVTRKEMIEFYKEREENSKKKKKTISEVSAHWVQTYKCYGRRGGVRARHISVHQDWAFSGLKSFRLLENTHAHFSSSSPRVSFIKHRIQVCARLRVCEIKLKQTPARSLICW